MYREHINENLEQEVFSFNKSLLMAQNVLLRFWNWTSRQKQNCSSQNM